MKILLIACLAIVMATSCKKQSICYRCTFSMTNGVQPPPQDYCGPLPHTFKDAQGNDLHETCMPK